jgi:hypothetical protein
LSCGYFRRIVTAARDQGLVLLLAAGLLLSPQAGTTLAQPPQGSAGSAYSTKYVFVVSINGLRATEAFGASDPALYIPRMNALRSQGSLYSNVYNLGGTWATPANYTIVDGCLELTAPSRYYYRYFHPIYPTMFEYYRRAYPDVPQEKVWAVVGAQDCTWITYSTHPYYAEDYGASMDVPNQHMNENRADEVNYDDLVRKMDRYHPSLVFCQMQGIQKSIEAGANWTTYLDKIKVVDRLVGQLWEKIQSDPDYRDQTTMLVMASQGRHDDGHGGWKGSGGICEGCKHVFILAVGPDITVGGKFDGFRQLTDICPTVGELMGFSTPFCEGSVLGEMIEGYPPRSQRAQSGSAVSANWLTETKITSSEGLVERPRIAVNGLGLHVVWVDDRSGHREIYYRLRPTGAADWGEDLQLSMSEREARAPAIAVDGDVAHVVWQEYRPVVGQDPLAGNWAIMHRQRAADGTWSVPDLVVSSVVEGNRECEIAWEPAVTACQGQVTVGVPMPRCWMRVFRRSASTWSGITLMDSSQRGYDQQYSVPQKVSMISSGGVSYVLWQQMVHITWRVKYSRSIDCGLTWLGDLAAPVLSWQGGSNDGSIAASEANVYAAWTLPTWLNGDADPWVPHQLLRNQSTDGGVTWQYHDGTVVRTYRTRHPELAAAGNTAVMVWEDYRDYRTEAPFIALSRSTDSGATWRDERASLGNGLSVDPAVATDGQSIYVVWRDRRDGSWQLYLAEVSDVEPSPTPTQATPTPTETQTATPTSSGTPTVAPTGTPTPTATLTATSEPTATGTQAAVPTDTATPTATPTLTETPTLVPSPRHVCFLPLLTRHEPRSSPSGENGPAWAGACWIRMR